MSSTPFSARGAVDLGALAAQRQAQQRAESALASAPAGVVIDVTEATFEAEVLRRSLQVPVVLDLWATWCGPCKTLSPILERLAAEYGGRFVLAKVDVDAEQRIAAAFQVQSIPSVFAVVKGQPVPLFQGALPEGQVRQYLDELLKLAAQQGLTGTLAGEAGESAEAAPAEAPVDPRFQAAYDAMEAGDWAAAESAYKAALAANPADEDARVGLAVVGLYARTDGVDPEAALTAAAAAPDDVDAQLLAADVEAMAGEWPAAFSRIVAIVRATAGDDRERARRRLLELFDIAGDDPSVAPARVALANALF